MRVSLALIAGVTTAGLAGYLNACGSGSFEQSIYPDGGPNRDGGSVDAKGSKDAKLEATIRLANDGPAPSMDVVSRDAKPNEEAVTLSDLAIVPANDSITVAGGAQATVAYKVMGVLDNKPPAVDVTDRFVFYVPGTITAPGPGDSGTVTSPNNYLIGSFPTNGGPTFTTRLPTLPTDPPQQGGTLTVLAEGYNPGATPDAMPSLLTLTTKLTVQLTATFNGPITPVDAPDGGVGSDAGAVPANAAMLFNGPANPAFAPVIAYPNPNVMLPPNLKFLEVHWVPAAGTTLFQVSFASAATSITYNVGCGGVPNGPFPKTACALVLDEAGYGYLASSNAGGGPVTVTVKGTDSTGTGVGTSAPLSIQFAQNAVNGGVYYWNVSATEIVRFDFGGTGLTPEVFLAPGDYGLPNTCVGCHALSAQGDKLVASLNGQGGGQIVYLNNLASSPTDAGLKDTTYLTLAGDSTNHIQFASFNPSGDEFIAVYGDGNTAGTVTNAAEPSWYNLWLHDGNTGAIKSGITLTYEPDHPAWSPDGKSIAVTHVGVHQTSQREFAGGIDVIPVQSGADGGTLGLGTPVTLIPSNVEYFNRYNPSWAPDSSFLYYTETSGCSAANWTVAGNEECDSDVHSNINATTWAILPQAGATPIHLTNAASPGYADTLGVTGTVPTPIDTFPRSTPFETVQGTGKLFWFTVASERKPGMRTPVLDTDGIQQTLWMFAVDPAKILAGEDGTYPGFFLPFQDLTTSNHIAEWTQQIVSATPGPPAPPPPPTGPGGPK